MLTPDETRNTLIVTVNLSAVPVVADHVYTMHPQQPELKS